MIQKRSNAAPSRFRRAIRWAGLGGCIAVVGLLVSTDLGFEWSWIGRWGSSEVSNCGVAHGSVEILSMSVADLISYPPGWPTEHFWGWSNSKGSWAATVSLWVPLLILGGPTAWAWWPRRLRSGACPRCGYDLSGNTTGTCPECGRTSGQSLNA